MKRRRSRPTAALPGTEAKILVLEMRAAHGSSLWHPRDQLEAPDCPENGSGPTSLDLGGLVARDPREYRIRAWG
jgi:hypothetical protein